MSEKLFYKDPYICSAECEVEDVIEKNDKYEVVLKSTPFYPEGGGQLCDTGYIDGIKVEYVYEKEDTIYHVMKNKPLNKLVKCEVDYEKRIDHTQQHSGEHLMSAAFFKLYNVSNDGFHMGDDYVTIDILMDNMNEDMMKKAEMEVNSYIFRNEPVKTYFRTKEEALKLPLRKPIKAEGKIRIVQMGENIDFVACCGTQVKRTGEVGIVKIIKWERYKGMTRVYIKCGFRALKDYEEKHDNMKALGLKFSIDDSEVLERVEKEIVEKTELKKQVSSLYSKIAEWEAEKLLKNASSKFIIEQYKEEKFDFLNNIYENLKDSDYILILSSLSDNRMMLAAKDSLGVNCGKIFKEKIKEFDGRGGGSPKRAQASFKDETSMNNFIEYIKSNL
ncbi:MAG: alanyl-tRNA editing protein [Clostridium sp.]|nr:alanyl-tRNA editing protein [Clostridium sp.]